MTRKDILSLLNTLNELHMNISCVAAKTFIKPFHITRQKDYLVSLSGQDNLALSNRFQVNYVMRNTTSFMYSLTVQKTRLFLDSISKQFAAAAWVEREIAEMFGLMFQKLIDSRRLLLDYNFKGYPLRKDFSLSSIENLNYSQTSNALIVVVTL